MASHLTITVRYDEDADTLINRCADAIDETSGMHGVLARAVRSGGALSTETQDGIITIGLSPMGELLLREFEALAKRPLSDAAKRAEAERIAELAGFRVAH